MSSISAVEICETISWNMLFVQETLLSNLGERALGLLMENGVKVKNAETINSSFPSFYNIMKSLGANLKKI